MVLGRRWVRACAGCGGGAEVTCLLRLCASAYYLPCRRRRGDIMARDRQTAERLPLVSFARGERESDRSDGGSAKVKEMGGVGGGLYTDTAGGPPRGHLE